MGTTTVRTRSYGKSKRVIVHGSFGPDGTNPIGTVKGEGFSAARTGVGIVEVTFDEIYGELESFTCTMQRSALADSCVQVGPHTAPVSPTKGKIQILHQVPSTGAAAEWPAANANNRVNFTAVLKLGSA